MIATLVMAQFSTAKIGINGLTCSACSKSVHLALKKLPFVDSVAMDLKNTEARILFKKGSSVDIEQLAKAVENAGFSIRYVNAYYRFKNTVMNSNTCLNDGSYHFQFINADNKTLNGEVKLIFIGKQYMSDKDLKVYQSSLKNKCTSNDKNIKNYIVTL